MTEEETREEIRQAHSSTTYCIRGPECHWQRATSLPWRPPDGLDPNMRKFICKRCGTEFYTVIPGSAYLDNRKGKGGLI